jgi:hypothetical protein
MKKLETKPETKSKLEILFEKLNKEVKSGKRKNLNESVIRSPSFRTRGDRGH